MLLFLGLFLLFSLLDWTVLCSDHILLCLPPQGKVLACFTLQTSGSQNSKRINFSGVECNSVLECTLSLQIHSIKNNFFVSGYLLQLPWETYTEHQAALTLLRTAMVLFMLLSWKSHHLLDWFPSEEPLRPHRPLHTPPLTERVTQLLAHQMQGATLRCDLTAADARQHGCWQRQARGQPLCWSMDLLAKWKQSHCAPLREEPLQGALSSPNAEENDIDLWCPQTHCVRY